MVQTADRRIAIFTSTMNGGGAQRAMLNLAVGLTNRGYSVDLVLSRAVGPYLNDLPDSVRVVDLNCKRVLGSLLPLTRYLKRTRPMAMVSSLDYVNIVALWARRLANVRTRLVVNEQNTLSKASKGAVKWRNRLTPKLARWFYPWADGIAAVSEDVRADLLQVLNIAPSRVDVIYNSVFREDVLRKSRQHVDHPWFNDGGVPVILAVGRLYEQKDYPTLIRAFAKLRERREAKLLILGEGGLRKEIEQLIRNHNLQDAVALPGFVDNPFAYMSRASLFVLSSRWEGLPLVLIEALCCGTPVVSTDCPSGPREVLRDPAFGRLVPVGDHHALANAMEESLQDTAHRPPEESWAPFELSFVVDRYLDVLMNH